MKVKGFKVGGRTHRPRKREIEKSTKYLIMLIKKEVENDGNNSSL